MRRGLLHYKLRNKEQKESSNTFGVMEPARGVVVCAEAKSIEKVKKKNKRQEGA